MLCGFEEQGCALMGTEDFQKVVEDSCDIFLVLWAGIRGITAEFQV